MSLPRPKPPKPNFGPCQHAECLRKARATFTCRTCEDLHAAGRRETITEIAFCHPHQPWAAEKIRRHALTKHPVNLVRAFVAGLKGEL